MLSSSITPRMDLNAARFIVITPNLSLYLSHSAYFVIIEEMRAFTVILLFLASFRRRVSSALGIRTVLMSVFSSADIESRLRYDVLHYKHSTILYSSSIIIFMDNYSDQRSRKLNIYDTRFLRKGKNSLSF